MANRPKAEPAPSGVLGRLCLVVFLVFNVAMAAWLLVLWRTFGEDLEAASEVERASAVIDATATTSIVVAVWAIGAAITGALAYLTRRPRR